MDSRVLPLPVQKMFNDFASQNFPFIWNILNDGHTVSLNLSWKTQDQLQLNPKALHTKSQAALRRDRERMAAFLEKKDKMAEIHLAPRARRAQDSDVSLYSCSTSSRSTHNTHLDKPVNDSVCSVTAATQTIGTSVDSVSTSMQTTTVVVEDAGIQTDNTVLLDVSTQCVSASTPVSKGETPHSRQKQERPGQRREQQPHPSQLQQPQQREEHHQKQRDPPVKQTTGNECNFKFQIGDLVYDQEDTLHRIEMRRLHLDVNTYLMLNLNTHLTNILSECELRLCKRFEA